MECWSFCQGQTCLEKNGTQHIYGDKLGEATKNVETLEIPLNPEPIEEARSC